MKKNIKREVFDYLLIIFAVIFIRSFIFSPIKVQQSSMSPTLESNDIMILNKIGYSINGLKRFDIVVIKYEGDYLIKRVVGLPNETIEYKDSTLLINGKKIDEPFIKEKTDDFKLESVIPDDNYFLMGDNRNNSIDSRMFGTVNEKEIEGKTRLIIFPIKRMGFI